MKMLMFRYSMYLLLLCVAYGCTLPGTVADTERFSLMQNQAQAGDVESQYQLGMQYTLNGRYAWDRIRGYRWFVDAAEKRHADA